MFVQRCIVVIIILHSQAHEQGVCAFLAAFIMSGYQFKQAQTVLDKLVHVHKSFLLSYVFVLVHAWEGN